MNLTRFPHLLKMKLGDGTAGIARINRLLSTRLGIDRTLSLIYYLSILLAPELSRLSVLSTASVRLRKLASKISEMRIFMRLWGLLGIYEWGATTLRNPPKDWVVKYLVLAQVAANTVFQVLENLAYLNRHEVLGFPKKTEGKMWLWSTRMWATHIALEFLRLERVRSLRKKKGKDAEEEVASWRKSLISNAAYAPLSLHFSVEKGLISDTAIGSLGSVAAIVGFRDAWARSA